MDGGLSPPFDQQVTLSPRNLSPNVRCGGVSALAENTFCSFQKVSPLWQRHLVLMRCYLLTIQFGNERTVVRRLLYKHISKNHKFQLWMGGLSPPFDQQVTLSPKNLSPNVRCGGVSALPENTFCSFQKVSPLWQRHLVLMRCYLLTIQFGNERTVVRRLLCKHISKNHKFQLWSGDCLHLLISKWHWVQKT